MKTTLEIPDDLFREAKAKAALEGRKLKDLVALALTAFLARPEWPVKTEHKPCPFPLVRGKGGPLLKKMNNQTITAINEEEDLARYQRSVGR